MVAIQGVFKVDDIEDTIFQNSHVQQHVEKSPDLGAIYSSRIEGAGQIPRIQCRKVRLVPCVSFLTTRPVAYLRLRLILAFKFDGRSMVVEQKLSKR
jgi:hypothetical protein